MDIPIPHSLSRSCQYAPESMAWLADLPALITEVKELWDLELGEPFDGDEVSCSWVAPVTRADGTSAILKIGLPHMEGLHELEGLLYWKGNHCIRVLDYIDQPRVMLLERCVPGTPLRELPELQQDEVIASLLKKLWSTPGDLHPFRGMEEVVSLWNQETRAAREQWVDPGLTEQGLAVLDDLLDSTTEHVLLATDLHAGNVLRAKREPWLVIDPKPFVGDPAYDATQHLYNCRPRLYANSEATIRRMADLLDVEYNRVRLWMFARAAAEPRQTWEENELLKFARAIAP